MCEGNSLVYKDKRIREEEKEREKGGGGDSWFISV